MVVSVDVAHQKATET